jgi:hypothetical protein
MSIQQQPKNTAPATQTLPDMERYEAYRWKTKCWYLSAQYKRSSVGIGLFCRGFPSSCSELREVAKAQVNDLALDGPQTFLFDSAFHT